MLLGRTDERLALDRLLAEARDGRSGVLALVGEPGIGKTALVEHAARAAEGMHMRVLRARGVESEAVIPFAGLADLLRPLLGAIERVPAPQAAALSGALALGPAGTRDRFATGAATLSLLSACAEDAPIAVLVDDAHWLDRPSAEALLFAARRLLADPVAIVLAVREGEPSLLDGADLRTLRLSGLNRDDAAALLVGVGLSGELLARLHRATGGNPLALLQLAPEAAQIAAAPEAAPIAVSSSIATAFLRRFGALPEPTRRMLVLVAASDTAHPATIARAAAQLGLEMEMLDVAAEAGLVGVGPDAIEFAHPLARAAMYSQAAPSERRAAHAAVAQALPDRDADQRAWHLAAASAGPDRRVSEALVQAGDRACGRSAYAVAAAAFERAAALAVAEEDRDELLLRAAEAAWLAGDAPRTSGLLDGAPLAPAATAARADHLRGQVAMCCGPVAEGFPLMVAAAERVAPSDPELAVVMLAQAVEGCFCTGDTAAMLTAAERAVALIDGGSSQRALFFASMAHGMALVADGQGEAGSAAARRAVEILERSDELRDDPQLLNWAAMGPLWLREADTGRGLVDRAFERAQTEAALGVLPKVLRLRARDQATTDQWEAAASAYDEGIRLARETGQRVELAGALAGFAWLQARQGRERECRAHAAEAAALCAELGVGLFEVWAIQALGDLELALGHAQDAIEHHQAQERTLRERGMADVDLSPAPELVDALLRTGRAREAAAAAAAFCDRAQEKGLPWALARAARCRGLIADADGIEAPLERARGRHAPTPPAVETARTRLAYGARLRRARKRVKAREQLRAAAQEFDRLGARPWAEQAAAELAATGETARRRDASTLDDLTHQEQHIARLLADGRTTREAAAEIFVSPKTVEYHLARVYRKLGINSRVQLAAQLRAAGSQSGHPGSGLAPKG